MQLSITSAMVEALSHLEHVPDTLAARIKAIEPAGDGYAMTLDDDDAMALAELVQWHVRTDPATGAPTAESAPFSALIALIDEAQF